MQSTTNQAAYIFIISPRNLNTAHQNKQNSANTISIDELPNLMQSKGSAIVSSRDGKRSVFVNGAQLDIAWNLTKEIIAYLDIPATEVKSWLYKADKTQHGEQRFYCRPTRLQCELWHALDAIVQLAPQGSAERLALLYLITTHDDKNAFSSFSNDASKNYAANNPSPVQL